IQCEVLEVTPFSRFAYSWKGGHAGNTGYGSPLDTVVTFLIDPTEAGSRLRLVHSGFVLPTNRTAYEAMSDGWKGVVKTVGAIASETPDEA
ncbi:MAG: SRPBCC family protein, partial [Brevundimonas sp.]